MNAGNSNWVSTTLGAVVVPEKGREVPAHGSDLPFIGMEHVESNTGRITNFGNSGEIRSASPVVVQGDVLYGRLRPYLNKVTIAPGHAYTSGEFIIFRGNSQINARFLRWRLAAQDFVDFACSLDTGDRPRVKWPQMAGFPLLLPPLVEQMRIADILEDHLSRLDAAGSALTTSGARLKRFHQASLDACVQAAAKDSSTSTTTIGSLAKVGTGATPLKSRVDYYAGGNIPWITSGDLSQGLIQDATHFVTPVALKETAIKVWPVGTLLVAMYGEGKTRGTTAELGIEATTNQACAAIQMHDPDLSLKSWVRLVLESNYWSMRRMASGGVQPNLNLGLVPIPLS